MADDRHGRAARGDADRRRRPSDGFRVRDARRFESLVDDAVGRLPDQLLDAMGDAELLVEDVPPAAAVRLDADEEDVPLAAWTPARANHPAEVRVFRRPLEARAANTAELVELIRLAIGQEVGDALGLDLDWDWPD